MGQAEGKEWLFAERVMDRLAERDRVDTEVAGAAPRKAQVAGRPVLLIPHLGESSDEAALPADAGR